MVTLLSRLWVCQYPYVYGIHRQRGVACLLETSPTLFACCLEQPPKQVGDEASKHVWNVALTGGLETSMWRAGKGVLDEWTINRLQSITLISNLT